LAKLDNIAELRIFLDQKANFYNNPDFIKSDPISIPHLYIKKEDIEISAFLTSIISWGNRSMIIRNALKINALMDNSPADFLMNYQEKDLARFNKFVHRTFNSTDCIYFISALKNIYENHEGLEAAFHAGYQNSGNVYGAISHFFDIFFELEHLKRTHKHVSNPAKGSAAKRINMFLRWMVRNDGRGVDFGIWNSIPSAALMIPLDVHTARLGRKYNLLLRKSNDWKAVDEYTKNLRKLDPLDPIKYDFALFGMGVFEGK